MEILTFNYENIGNIRTLDIDGVVWFVGKDVAKLLGYERPTKAVQDHVDKEDINGVPIRDSIGRMQQTPIINESGLYSLILSSKLPDAKKFKRWVTSEVLPAVRKHGAYLYSLHINLRSRKNNVCNKNIKLIDLLTEKEMVSAAKTAVAICDEANLNAGGIISETNLARLK